MNEVDDSNRLRFSIRGLLVITTVIALHVGVPFLTTALFATVAAAIVLGLISVMPVAAIGQLWNGLKGGELKKQSEMPDWIAYLYIGILASIYLSVAIYESLFST